MAARPIARIASSVLLAMCGVTITLCRRRKLEVVRRRRFGREYVKRGTRQLPTREAFAETGFIDQAATCEIDQNGAGPHHREPRRIQYSVGRGIEWQMECDNVALLEELLEGTASTCHCSLKERSYTTS